MKALNAFGALLFCAATFTPVQAATISAWLSVGYGDCSASQSGSVDSGSLNLRAAISSCPGQASGVPPAIAYPGLAATVGGQSGFLSTIGNCDPFLSGAGQPSPSCMGSILVTGDYWFLPILSLDGTRLLGGMQTIPFGYFSTPYYFAGAQLVIDGVYYRPQGSPLVTLNLDVVHHVTYSAQIYLGGQNGGLTYSLSGFPVAVQPTLVPVPEPGSVFLMFAAVAFLQRRIWRKAK